MTEKPMRVLAIPVCLACLGAPAHASSEDAWSEFRENVRTACLALVREQGTVTIEVNPFGTESYGVAIITVKADWGEDRMACVFDKVTGKAELSASFSQ
jgi:hypothetical protein